MVGLILHKKQLPTLTKVPVHLFVAVVTVEPQYLSLITSVTIIFVVLLNVFEPAFAVILMLSPNLALFFPSILAAPVEVLK